MQIQIWWQRSIRSIEERAHPLTDSILGVVLAGGLATRMGGVDKGKLSLGPQKTILDEVLKRLMPQVDATVINANGDSSRFDQYELPVVVDSTAGFKGPLAGVLAGLEFAENHQYEWVCSVAADTPFFPTNLVCCFMQEAEKEKSPVVLASSYDALKGRWMRQPTFGLWHIRLIDPLRQALDDGVRKIVVWTDAVGGVEAQFIHKENHLDPFFNVNTPEDLVIAQRDLAT